MSDQLTPDHADEITPEVEQRYTNYGLIDDLRDINVIPLRLDTWYYDYDGTNLGTMELGHGGVRVETGVAAFVADHLQHFTDAFAGLIRPRPGLQVAVQTKLPSIQIGVFYIDLDDGADLHAGLQAGMARAGSHYVTALSAQLDVCVAMRQDDGSIAEQWLYNTGSLNIMMHNHPETYAEAVSTGSTTWIARLGFGAISAFRRDNAAVLQRARERWRAFHAQHPDDRWNNAATEETLLVTLIDPPAGTPPDNQELYARNAPRLYEAIARWEQAVGRHFHWSMSLE